MIKTSFKVPIYDIHIDDIQIETPDDFSQFSKIAKKLNLTEDDIDYVINNIRTGFNGGDTFRNMRLRRILVIIYRCKSEKVRRNVVNHEKRHVEDRILEYYNITDIEASAFLAGYLSEFIY